MDRDTRNRLRSHAGDDDWAIQKAVKLRAARQVTNIVEPSLPGTGTDRISALLAEARRSRNEARATARSNATTAPRTDGTPSGG